MKHYYFAYGMNTNLTQMDHRCPGAIDIGPARLEGYKLVFRRHADVELEYGSDVNGLLWEITDEHLRSLDEFEGFPQYYIRSRAWVQHDGKWYVAWIYQMTDQTYLDEPSNFYLSSCIEGYEQNGIDVSQLHSALEESKYYDSYLA